MNVYMQLMLLAFAQTCLKIMYFQSVSMWNAYVILHLLPKGFHEASW